VLLVSIFNFDLNVEVGRQTIISKSVTLRTLVAFFEIVIPGPWSSFSVVVYNQLTGVFTITTKKRPGVSEDSKPRLGKKG
jgi:hypothetical protein